MIRLFQLLTVSLDPAQWINLLFAGLCLWAAFGLSPRWVAVLSAMLYLCLVFA